MSDRSETKIGTVRWFNLERGYGFITPDGTNTKDVFVHIVAVKQSGMKTLEQNQRLSFAIGEARGKPVATDLRTLA